MGLRPANAFGGSQLPRIADDKLVELCVGVLVDDENGSPDLFNEAVETLGTLRNGGALSDEDRDKWIAIARKAGCLPVTKRKRPREPMAHDPDRFSALPTEGTKRAEEILKRWARPVDEKGVPRMPVPPNRRSA